VAVVTCVAIRAGNRVDNSGRANAANSTVSGLGKDEILPSIDHHRNWYAEQRVLALAVDNTAVARVGSGKRAERSVRSDLADPLEPGIGDIEISRRIENHASREEEIRPGGGRVVIHLAESRVTGNGFDHALRIHAPDTLIVAIANIKVARVIERHAVGTAEIRLACRAVGEEELTRAGDSAEHAGAIDLAQTLRLY